MILIISFGGAGCYRQIEKASVVDRNDLPLKIRRLQGDLYLVEDFNFRKHNAVFLAHRDGILFCDATYQDKTAEQLIWKSATFSMADFIGVVVTAGALAHTGGLSRFRGHEIPIYMHKNTAGQMQKNWGNWNTQMQKTFGAWQEPTRIRPDFVIEKEATLVGGKAIVLDPHFSAGAAELVVFFPEQKTLFAGSTLPPPPDLLPAARQSYIHGMRELYRRFEPQRIVVARGQPLHPGQNLVRWQRELAAAGVQVPPLPNEDLR